MVLLTLMTWGDDFSAVSVDILGDNLGSLNSGLKLKGKGPLLAISKEISWRQARRGWTYQLGHLPSERNNVADALSRLADPKGKHWPAAALGSAARRDAPQLKYVWLACPI